MDESKLGDKELLEKIEMQIMVGEFDQALITLRSFNMHYPYRMETRPLYKQIMIPKRIMDQVIQYMNLNLYSKALKKLRQLFPEFPNCDRIRLLMIECCIHTQGVTNDAEVHFNQLSDVEYLYVDEFQNKCLKLYVRSLMNFYNCEFNATKELLENLFSMDKCHIRGQELHKKLVEVLAAFEKVEFYEKNEDWEECLNYLTRAMDFEPRNQLLTKDILVSKAAAYVKMVKITEAEEVLAQLHAMGVDSKSTRVQRIREEIYYAKTALGQVNDANIDPNFESTYCKLHRLYEHFCSKLLCTLLDLKLLDCQLTFIPEDFQKLLSIVAQMDAYQILGLDSTSHLTQAHVEQASRQLVKRYHPDNFASNLEIHGCCVEIFKHIKQAEKLILEEINRLKSSII